MKHDPYQHLELEKRLTKSQKIKILKRMLEKFGPNGEHWTKHKYFGQRINEKSSRQVSRERADCWCAVGCAIVTMEELGLTWRSVPKKKLNEMRISRPGPAQRVLSLHDLVTKKTKAKSVEGWNDKCQTYDEVRDMITERIAQLEGTA